MGKFLSVLLALLMLAGTSQGNEIDIIKKNYTKLLLSEESGEKKLAGILYQLPKEEYYSDQMVVELMDRYPITEAQVKAIMDNLNPDGSWKNIDYSDTNPSGWKPKKHLENTLVLTKYYRSQASDNNPLKAVEDAIHRALGYWFREKPVCPNWWYNQIGAPKVMGAIALLFEEKMSPQEMQGALEVMEAARFGMTGQNKVWLAGNVLVKGLLQNDTELVQAARDTIFSEIQTGNLEGIQPDNSFHQHGTQLQFGNYGAAYIASMGLWSKVLAGTSLALRQPQLDILSRLINEGYSRVLWKGYMDVNSLGRQLFHNAQPHKAFSVGFTSNMLMDADKQNSAQYKKLLDENFYNPGKPTQNTGLNHFWTSDYTVQRRPAWMASVRMSSLRVTGAEAGNGDNMKGYYLADGATYVYVNGSEYNNIFPCWDWRKIPGITSYETDAPLRLLRWSGYNNQSNFVGNVNDGSTGIMAMDLNRDGLQARKAWIFTDDFVLCMGTAIAADSGLVVATSIEQREKGGGSLLRFTGRRWENISDKSFEAAGAQRFYHDRTGYIVLDGSKVNANVSKKTGKWRDVMNSYPEDYTETKNVISLWIDHGKDPQDGSYTYLILPAKKRQEVENFDLSKIKINNNSRQFQSVTIGNTTYVAAYPLADIPLIEGIRLETTNTGLFMITREKNRLKVTVSDPTQLLETMNIVIAGKPLEIKLPGGDKKGTPVTVYVEV